MLLLNHELFDVVLLLKTFITMEILMGTFSACMLNSYLKWSYAIK
jgi:hypothetical protein